MRPTPTSRVREWSRFTLRQGLLLTACVAGCIVANRENDPGDLIRLVAWCAVGSALLLMLPAALTVLGGLARRGADDDPPGGEPR
jgi:hypothetical protein